MRLNDEMLTNGNRIVKTYDHITGVVKCAEEVCSVTQKLDSLQHFSSKARPLQLSSVS